MSVSLKSWVKIDRVLGPAYRTFHFAMTSITPVSRDQRGPVVVIKLFGMGSIIRLLGICEESGVDTSGVTIVTSHSHKELCELWGLNAVFIETTSVQNLVTGCLRAIATVGRLRPSMIVDLERCSNLVGIFRTILAWRAGCKTLSFERRSLASPKSIIHAVDSLTQEQIFQTGIKHLPRSTRGRSVTDVPVAREKVIVNINASELLEIRRYGLPLFAATMKSIHAQNPGVRFYFSGVRRERAYVQKLIDMLPGLPAHNVAGDWTLGRLTAELSDCNLLITGDSAPLHLARYMNVTTLSIWGPTQPAHFGYLPAERFHIASLRMACSPCFLHPQSKPATACKGAITCMRQLKPDDVAAAAIALLSNTQDSRDIVLPPKLRIHAPQPQDALG